MKNISFIGLMLAMVASTMFFASGCDNRSFEVESYNIISMTATPDTIYADNNETYSSVRVHVRDDDNFPVVDEPVRFRTNIGGIIYQVNTDSMGVAETVFYDNNQLGEATIEAFVGNSSETTIVNVVEVPDPPSVDVASIGFAFTGQVDIQVQGTGGQESFELKANLKDANGNPVLQPKLVYFELLHAPQGTNISNEPTGIDSVWSDNGQATVWINSGSESGTVQVKAYTYRQDGTEVSATKSNIVVHGGPPNSVSISTSGISSGVDMGAGVWKIELAAMITDVLGNPVSSGTAVHFSLPADPNWANVQAAAFVGNENTMGDSLAGVAYTNLTYRGTFTNEILEIRVEVADFDGIDDIKLPIQYPHIDMVPIPRTLTWTQGNNPEYQEMYVSLTVQDGQNNRINNQLVHFTTTLGTPLEPFPPDTGNPYTGLTGVIDGESGRLDKTIRFYKYECPPPSPQGPGEAQGDIQAGILGANVWVNDSVLLIRYVE